MIGLQLCKTAVFIMSLSEANVNTRVMLVNLQSVQHRPEIAKAVKSI